MSGLSTLIRPELVAISPAAATAEEAIGVLARSLVDAGLAAPGIVAAALAREEEFPTGLALDGPANVAIPHANPEFAVTPAIAIATFAQPVPFRRMDDPDESVPVRLVVFLALTDGASQIQTLRALTRLLQDGELVQATLDARSPEAVIAALAAGEVPA